MASAVVHRGFGVVMGTTISGVAYSLAGAWTSNGTAWNGIVKGEATYTPEAEIIEHRDPLTGARCGTTYFNQSVKVSITFVPGGSTQTEATNASRIAIIPGAQITLTSADTLMGNGDGTVGGASEVFIIESASRVMSTTAECVWNLGLARYGDGAGKSTTYMGDVIGS